MVGSCDGVRWFGGEDTVLGGSFQRGEGASRRGGEWTGFADALQRAHACHGGSSGSSDGSSVMARVLGGVGACDVLELAVGDVVALCPMQETVDVVGGEEGGGKEGRGRERERSGGRSGSPVVGPGPGPAKSSARHEGDAMALPALRAVGWVLAALGGQVESELRRGRGPVAVGEAAPSPTPRPGAGNVEGQGRGQGGQASDASQVAMGVILDLVRGRRRCREVVAAMACWCPSSHGLGLEFVEAWAAEMLEALSCALQRTGAPHTDAPMALVRLDREVPHVVRSSVMARLWAGPALSRALAERSPSRASVD